MRHLAQVLGLILLFQGQILAQTSLPLPDYDESVPTLEKVVGHGWGQDISSYGEIESYLKAVTQASSKLKLVHYATSWEGRKLYYVIVASEANMARLDSIKSGLQQLAHPQPNQEKPEQLLVDLPAVVWLAYGIHGNEISSPNAALQTIYHLAAAEGDTLVDSVLQNCVAIIDTSQNPDGRDRFVNFFRQTTGRWPDADPQSAEHNEGWPRGRSNHYLFDMNRDWFALTQPETRGRVAAYLEWYPQVFVDLHEMGGNSTYYFAPPALPLNPVMTGPQKEWLATFGRNNGRWFDRLQWDYFTRESFDSFYPGYGESLPMFLGSIGMTYEQASVRGMALDRDDETTLHFSESVEHHFVASLATLETAASNRRELLEYFLDYRATAISEGASGEIKEYLLPPGKDPNRTAKLASKLVEQGIAVRKAEASFQADAVIDHYGNGEVESKEFPAGTFLVSLSQPSGRLAKTLLDRDTPMGDDFLAEQRDRKARGLNEDFYDITGWSFPYLYDVECFGSQKKIEVTSANVNQPISPKGQVTGPAASVAYLVPWNSNSSGRLLAEVMRRGIRIFSTDEAFSIGGQEFPRGSLIIKVKNNPEDLHSQLASIAQKTGATVVPTDSAWVDSGVNFGSNNVLFLKKVRVAMAYNTPTSVGSVGSLRYLLEQAYGYPVTLIQTSDLSRSDLSDYDVLILPDYSRWGGGYQGILGGRGLERIRSWVEAGGTLIAIGETSRWLTEEKVAFLASEAEDKTPDDDSEEGEEEDEADDVGDETDDYDIEASVKPESERPDLVPGAILRITVDNTHWLGYGYDEDANALVESRLVMTPLKLDRGRNVARYASEDRLVLSGFTWEDSREQLAGKAYLMYQSLGRGNVVAFAENPTYRAFMDGLDLFVLNAIFFGPAH